MPEKENLNSLNIPVCIKDETLINSLKYNFNAQNADELTKPKKCFKSFVEKDIAYITNYSGHSVSVVDIHTAREIDRIILQDNAYALDFNPNHEVLYVSNFPSGKLTIIKIPENIVTDVIDLNLPPFTASGSAGVAAASNGCYVYVANYLSNNISVVNTHEKRVETQISLNAGPSQIAITPDGNLAYVTLADTTNVAVVDLNSNSVIKYIKVGTDPEGIAISPTRPLALVVNQVTDNLSTINTQIAESSDTFIHVGNLPTEVVFQSKGRIAYVTNQLNNTVSIVDVFTNNQTGTLQVGRAPIGIDINYNSRFIVVCNAESNTVTIIDRYAGLNREILVGSSPFFVKILK